VIPLHSKLNSRDQLLNYCIVTIVQYTCCRLLVKVASSINVICDLKLPEWKMVKCNALVEKRLHPAVSFQSTRSELPIDLLCDMRCLI